ncbi:MAG: methylmalonyl Co-A mutase-associated GTPase MeaB, partial [Luteolibacter sp.]
VGQNEVTVRSMVDFFLLVLISGGGDELQGMKKGVIEIADLIAVNKADGDNVQAATLACAEFNRVLHFLKPITDGWEPRCVTCSAFSPESLQKLWSVIAEFVTNTRESGVMEQRRKNQSIEWMHAMIQEELRSRFYRNPAVSAILPEIEHQVANQSLPVATAVRSVMKQIDPA